MERSRRGVAAVVYGLCVEIDMSPPNVLFICVDHWPGRLMNIAGNDAVMTPTLDQLARNGVRFTNAYSATPTCVPARRGLMTGTTARAHGDRVFNETLPMPELPTLAGTFAAAGYQTFAVGKLHVYPQRDRIGFDDALINEEGRHHLGLKADDYELFLADQGYAGQELVHGMCNNNYMTRAWHLPEYCHPTNWTAREMCRVIKRRDPTRPGFWFMSFNHPHPPLTPLREYADMYQHVDVPEPIVGDWATDFDRLPYALKVRKDKLPALSALEMARARRAFYGLCTHIDHQIRLVIGMLREEGLLDNTIIVFLSDHGDMLGNHGQFAKGLAYEESARVPMILVPTADDRRIGHHRVDDRLVELRDVMPTLLDLAGIAIPSSVEGVSVLSGPARDDLYIEHYEDERATRALRDKRYKIIYYPVGHRVQLFDLQNDPDERCDLSEDPSHTEVREALTARLIKRLYGDDLAWVDGDKLVGRPDIPYEAKPNRGLTGQRGWRFM